MDTRASLAQTIVVLSSRIDRAGSDRDRCAKVLEALASLGRTLSDVEGAAFDQMLLAVRRIDADIAAATRTLADMVYRYDAAVARDTQERCENIEPCKSVETIPRAPRRKPHIVAREREYSTPIDACDCSLAGGGLSVHVPITPFSDMRSIPTNAMCIGHDDTEWLKHLMRKRAY